MAINAEWHKKNRMAKNATAEQRLAWHREHAKVCGCRSMPPGFLDKLKAAAAKSKALARTRAKRSS